MSTSDATHHKSLREYIRASGKTQAKVAEEIGADPTYVSQMVNGRVNWVKSDYFPALVNTLSIPPQDVRELRPEAVITMASPALPADEIRPVPDLHRVPVRGMAAAGAAFYSEDNILDYEYVAADEYRPRMLAVQIDGDSMEPTIPNGSRVYVDTSLTDPQDGKMFLIHVHGDGFIVKRARMAGTSWLLLSDNPKYPTLTPEDADVVGQDVPVIGGPVEGGAAHDSRSSTSGWCSRLWAVPP